MMRIAIVGAGDVDRGVAVNDLHLPHVSSIDNVEMACLWTEYGLDSVIALGGCIADVCEQNQVHQLSQG
jgi:hypothetical protein